MSVRWLRNGSKTLVCALLFGPFAVDGQDIHHYTAVVSELTTTMQEKQLLEALHDTDELGEFVVERSTGAVEIKTRERMDRARFDHLIGRFHMGIVSFEEVAGRPKSFVRVPRRPQMADMPLYIDTGDPVRDNQRYEAYKAAWIAVHPDEYRELTEPQQIVPPNTTEQ